MISSATQRIVSFATETDSLTRTPANGLISFFSARFDDKKNSAIKWAQKGSVRRRLTVAEQ